MTTRALVKVDDNAPGALTFGVANGVPGPLDGSGKLPTSQVPASSGSDSSALHQPNNLSDVGNAATALANLGGVAQSTAWVDVDSRAGATDDAKMQAAITAAAGLIGSTGSPIEIRMSGRLYNWTGTVPTVPMNLAGKLTVNMAGSTVKLTSAAPAFLETVKVADYDVVQNVHIRDGWVDCNNVYSYGHVIFGTALHSSSSLTTHNRVGVKNVHVYNVRAFNIPTDWTGTNHSLRAGVYLVASLSGTAGETAVSITDVVCEDVRVEGGEFGIAAAARITTSSAVFVDNIHFNRCHHDTGSTPPNFLPCTNFFIGGRGYGGHATISNCRGLNSGDDGVETNGMETVCISNTVITDASTNAFYHYNYGLPKYRNSQRVTYRNSHARIISLVTNATNQVGRGWGFATEAISTTTTASVSIGASTIPLTAVTGLGTLSTAYFPRQGVVYTGTQTITYTGITTTTLTGVTGVTATINSGDTITLVNDLESAVLAGCTYFKTGQTYWEANGNAVRANGPIRELILEGMRVNCEAWNATISTASQPSEVYVNALPTAGEGFIFRSTGLHIRERGRRAGGSTADWTGISLSSSSDSAISLVGTVIDNGMTGMSAATAITGLFIGQAFTAGSGAVIVKGYKIRGLGDVGSVQCGIRTPTSSAFVSRGFDFSGLDFFGLLSGGVDVFNLSGGFVWEHSRQSYPRLGVARQASAVTVTTGTFQWTNLLGYPVRAVVTGGTVSLIQLGTDSSHFTATGMTSGMFWVDSGEVLQIVNTVAPTLNVIPTK
jgi:hypothetical protein